MEAGEIFSNSQALKNQARQDNAQKYNAQK
jgi:hypothetical protein